MPRIVALVVLAALSLPGGAGAGPPPEVRWLVYITAPPGEFQGDLHAVRSDGRRDHVILEGSVLDTDIGPEREVYAVRATDDVPDSLVELDVRGARAEPLGSAPPGTTYLGVATSARGDVAYMRRVEQPDIPRHLEKAASRLRRTNVPVLAPPIRPPGTSAVVVESTRDFYRLLFTNDPRGTMAHVEQVNVFVTGTLGREPPPPEATPVDVREEEGSFYCGASTCFLQWRKGDVSYTVGEFGSERDAVRFAESLFAMKDLAGPMWRLGQPLVPELVIRTPPPVTERVVATVAGFCECSYRPTDLTSSGAEVLVVEGIEGATRLVQYAASGDPTTVAEPSEGVITDAAYGPDGILVLESGEASPEGTLRTLDGRTIAESVVAFDVGGGLLAYVDSGGTVTVRDLETGREHSVAEGAVDVSLAPAAVRVRPTDPPPPPPPEPSPEDGFLLPWVLLGAAAGALVAGAVVLRLARRRR